MKTKLWRWVLPAGCLAGAILPASAATENDLLTPPREESPFDNRQKPDADSLIFAKYYKWKRVTPKLESAAGGGTSICSPVPGTNAGLAGPESFFNVYADKNAELAFSRPASTPFPEGAMIVKELFATNKKGADSRTLLAMVKRDEGFDPAHGDWEFLALRRLKQPIIVERGKIAHCHSCHDKAKAQDFVFRGYATGKR